ncbi:alpha/beta hydrolase family protein [Nocardiopsis coralliicola]
MPVSPLPLRRLPLWRHCLRTAAAVGTAAALAAGCSPAAPPTAELPGADPVEHEVEFDGGSGTVPGTLALPAEAGEPVPAALIVSGSGPTDRDGNSPGRPDAGTNLNLARVLAGSGVASLRYDKYGSGDRPVPESGEDGAEASYGLFEEEMAAAYAELAARPEVDPERIAVLGHSEGALFALGAPEAVEGPPPAGLVLVAPPGEVYLDLIDRQITEQVRSAEAAGSMDAAGAADLLTGTRTAIARVRAGEPLPQDLPEQIGGIFAPETAGFLREIDALDPAELAADLPPGMPTLVLRGTEDAQVTAGEVDRLAAALGTEQIGLDGADHVLRTRPGGPGSAAAPDDQRPFTPDADGPLAAFFADLPPARA